MGYTHYFTNKKATPKQWNDFTTTVEALIIASSAKICNGFGEDSPIIEDTHISFNGDASEDFDHEMFLIDNEDVTWSFCKTARKPYDEVVVASLIYGERIGVIADWSSDGEDEDHEEGRALLESINK